MNNSAHRTSRRFYLIYGVIALAALAVAIGFARQGASALGTVLPALLTGFFLAGVERLAARAAKAEQLQREVDDLQHELSELAPGGRALEQATADMALAAHTLRGVDSPITEAAFAPRGTPPSGPLPTPPGGRAPLPRRAPIAAAPVAAAPVLPMDGAFAAGPRGAVASAAAEDAEGRGPFGRRPTPAELAAAEPARDWTNSAPVAPALELETVPALAPVPPRTSSAPALPPTQPAVAASSAGPSLAVRPAAAPNGAAASMAATVAASGPNYRPAGVPSTTTLAPLAAAGEQGLAELLRRTAVDGDVEIQLQPIAALSDRKARFYDVYPRLKRTDGSRVTPAEYWTPAHQLGLALVLERHVATRAISILRKLSERGRVRGFFIRLSVAALSDRNLVAAVASHLEPRAEIAENVVIELAARDYLRFAGPERDGMAELANLGVRFALEGVESLVVDRHRLAADRIFFLKMSPQALSNEHRIAGFSGMSSLIGDLRRSGIDVILDQITDEALVALANDCGLILGQGPLFGEPRALAPEFLGEVARTRATA